MSLRRRAYAPPVPKMPPGLIELMDGLARDVLKNNPENIFEFCAQHMQTLLKIRDGHNAPKPLITLEEKIAKAQKKINERAEQRRRAYDEQLQLISAENFNKQTVLPPCNDTDDSVTTDIKEIENKSMEIKEEEKDGKTNTIEQNEIEKPSADNFTGSEIKDEENVLQTCEDDEIKDDKEVSNVDILDVIDSDTNKIIILVKEGDEFENTESNHTVDCLETPLEENHIVELNEGTSVVIDLNAENGDKNDVSISTTSPQNELDMQLDNTVNAEEITITEQNNDLELQNKDAESGKANNVQTLIDENKAKDMSVEITADNHLQDTIISSPIDSISNNNTKGNDDIHTEQNEIQIDVPSLNNTLNQNGDEVILITETKTELSDNPTEDLSESVTKKEDDKILAVILSIKSPEPDLAEIKDSEDSIKSIDCNEKKEEMSDFESTPDTTDDKSRNMNSSMDLETAAITIQKVFRSFLFKTKTASYDDPTTVDMNLLNEDKEKEESSGVNMKDRRLLGISRMDTVLQTVNEEKSLSLSDDSSTLSSAATIIQAHVRGFLVRNKFHSNKTTSTNSLIDSDAPSIPSLEVDSDNRKSKTVLNIHIVPEGGHYVSRDESILTSMDLSLDSSPPSSVNLHPLGYDKSERRKLKREDAIQSVSPPSNNSGKLSDDVDSERDALTVDHTNKLEQTTSVDKNAVDDSSDVVTNGDEGAINKDGSLIENLAPDAADEMDVVTPFIPIEEKISRESDNSSKLLHSGEFHDIVVPTNVTRSDTSVVREFQNVLVYFILWNN